MIDNNCSNVGNVLLKLGEDVLFSKLMELNMSEGGNKLEGKISILKSSTKKSRRWQNIH
jgi:hypothetical protein